MLIDFGFDLAGRREPRLLRGAIISALGALTEAAPLVVAFYVLRGVFLGTVTWSWMPWIVGSLLGLVALTTLFRALGGIDGFVATYGLVSDLRLNLADHLRRLPMGFWSRQRTGTVSSVLTDEFGLYSEIVTHVWTLVVTNLAKPAGIAVFLLVVEWRLGVVAIATLPLGAMAIPWSHRLLNRASDRLAETKGRTHARLVEYTQGIATLREYGRTGPFQERLDQALAELEAEQLRVELAPAPALFTYNLVVWLGFALLLGVGAWGVGSGWVQPETYLLVALVSLRLFGSAGELSTHLAMARFALRTLKRIRALFDEAEQPDVVTGPEPVGASIRLDGVSFSYGEREALRGVEAEFREGTITALVGRSGSGKTTLAHLVTRLWDVDEGCITLGGVDLRKMPQAELHRRVATVLQDVVLFEETVFENIRLGRPEASLDEVVAAAKAARAHEFIEELPLGYETVLGEGGSGLSGGQRQRISIARALLLDAPVLILDEATSSVDSQNELLIQQAIGELTAGRTVLVIAHRLWTVQHADQILVLDEGRVVERGTHGELLRREGLYRTLWDTQQTSRGWRLCLSE